MMRIMYTSVAGPEFSKADLVEVLGTAREKNKGDDLTGLLIFNNNLFFQVLEGPEAPLMACFHRIAHDPRHSNIKMLSKEPTDERLFNRWRMGFANPEIIPDRLMRAVRDTRDVRDRMESVKGSDALMETSSAARMIRMFLMQLGECQLGEKLPEVA